MQFLTRPESEDAENTQVVRTRRIWTTYERTIFLSHIHSENAPAGDNEHGGSSLNREFRLKLGMYQNVYINMY